MLTPSIVSDPTALRKVTLEAPNEPRYVVFAMMRDRHWYEQLLYSAPDLRKDLVMIDEEQKYRGSLDEICRDLSVFGTIDAFALRTRTLRYYAGIIAHRYAPMSIESALFSIRENDSRLAAWATIAVVRAMTDQPHPATEYVRVKLDYAQRWLEGHGSLEDRSAFQVSYEYFGEDVLNRAAAHNQAWSSYHLAQATHGALRGDHMRCEKSLFMSIGDRWPTRDRAEHSRLLAIACESFLSYPVLVG